MIFQNLFKSHYLNDKHPVVFMKDMAFENLKSLVEYMYKGEANVPQNMLEAFIKDGESLQIRGLAECGNMQFDSETASPTPSAAISSRSSNKVTSAERAGAALGGKKSSNSSNKLPTSSSSALGPGGILAARLAKMSDQVRLLFFNQDFLSIITFDISGAATHVNV